jgi:hypothetical protein
MSQPRGSLPEIFRCCFNCLEIRYVHVNVCRCTFNPSVASRNILRLCSQNVRRITPVNSHTIFTNCISNENLRKLAVNMGYKKNIPFKYCSYVCAIQFGKYSGWFQGPDGIEVHRQLVQNFITALVDPWSTIIEDRKILADITSTNILQSRRIEKWRTEVDPDILRPPLIDAMVASMFQVSIRAPDYSAGIIDIDRNTTIVEAVFQPAISSQQPRRLTIDILTPRREGPMRPTTGELRPRVERLQDEVQILSERYRYTEDENKIKNNWKAISIDTEIIVQHKNIDNDKTETETETETCPICCENIEDDKRVITNCNHVLCSDCIGGVISKCGSKCTMCRGIVSKLQFSSTTQLVRHLDIKIKAIVS